MKKVAKIKQETRKKLLLSFELLEFLYMLFLAGVSLFPDIWPWMSVKTSNQLLLVAGLLIQIHIGILFFKKKEDIEMSSLILCWGSTIFVLDLLISILITSRASFIG